MLAETLVDRATALHAAGATREAACRELIELLVDGAPLAEVRSTWRFVSALDEQIAALTIAKLDARAAYRSATRRWSDPVVPQARRHESSRT